MTFASTEIIDEVTRLAGILSLLAADEIRRGGGWKRARQRFARPPRHSPCRSDNPSGRGSSTPQRPAKGTQRYARQLRFSIAMLWVVLLLAIVSYAEVRGEAGLVELEAMGVTVVTE